MTFVVLSGYGDYEYTSQAMELGRRHYGRRNRFIMQTTKKQKVPDGERPVVHISVVCGFFRVRPQGRTLFLFHHGWVYVKSHLPVLFLL